VPTNDASTRRGGGSWLCGNGEYSEFVAKACALDPGLKIADPKGRHQPFANRPSRVVMLTLPVNATALATNVSSAEFQTSSALGKYLRKPAMSSVRRIFLVEGLCPATVDVLGSHFKMSPTLFKNHERTTIFPNRHAQANDNPSLPSLKGYGESYMLRYYEILSFNPGTLRRFEATCADCARHIGVTRMAGKIVPEGIVRRKMSYWSQKRVGGGWDVVILCDPPVRRLCVGRRENMQTIPVTPEPFQGGYPDFIKRDSIDSSFIEGPSRVSFLEDFRFYLSKHNDVLESLEDPESVMAFAKKLVASHFLQLIYFVRALAAERSWNLSRRQADFNLDDLGWVEEQWSDLQSTSRRCTEYIEDAELNLRELGICASDGVRAKTASWIDCEIDMQYIHHRLQGLQDRVNTLSDAMTGLGSLVANRLAQKQAVLTQKDSTRSLKEAKRTRLLTIVGLLFIPLAYSSSIFSIAGDYGPGGSAFWVYWVTSVPMVVIVFCAAIMLDQGLDDQGLWSPRLLLSHFQPRKVPTMPLPSNSTADEQSSFLGRKRRTGAMKGSERGYSLPTKEV